MQGYISYTAPSAPPAYTAGVGFYAAAWSLTAEPLANFQVGLPGTWVVPNNSDDTLTPLCPPGTFALTGLPGWAPTYDWVFQTIEGGLGYWAGNQFHAGPPKFSMNGTPDCYTHQIASPGWPFFNGGSVLPDALLGIAQVTNRLLVPPDGINLAGSPKGEMMGYSWMALPWLAATSGPPATGNQGWTLFVNTQNFRGPVAFYTPRTWSRISADYAFDVGRGLDSRPGRVGGGAIEVNTVPFIQRALSGTTYGRGAQLLFPVDSSNRTSLVSGVNYYSAEALAACFGAWRAGGAPCPGAFASAGTMRPQLAADPLSFTVSGAPLTGFEGAVRTQVFADNSFGLQWSPTAAVKPGEFPAYVKRLNTSWQTLAAADVPAGTGLGDVKFALASGGSPYAAPKSGAWTTPGPALGPYAVALRDGSTVTYSWYRFVDQPALQNSGLAAAERASLQSFVEALHRSWSIDADYMPPVASGTLVALESALVVSPPPGFTSGYVPIVTGQRASQHCQSDADCPASDGCHISACASASRTCTLNSDSCAPAVAPDSPVPTNPAVAPASAPSEAPVPASGGEVTAQNPAATHTWTSCAAAAPDLIAMTTVAGLALSIGRLRRRRC